ncbi:hypothetical protein VNO77_15966 [Canavalia gladiata]|uniref:Uncharacterized protein n=1 Tax=Canavalia gladiata TaxID=3824 RepID=A0AAN9QW60_CANGL
MRRIWQGILATKEWSEGFEPRLWRSQQRPNHWANIMVMHLTPGKLEICSHEHGLCMGSKGLNNVVVDMGVSHDSSLGSQSRHRKNAIYRTTCYLRSLEATAPALVCQQMTMHVTVFTYISPMFYVFVRFYAWLVLVVMFSIGGSSEHKHKIELPVNSKNLEPSCCFILIFSQNVNHLIFSQNVNHLDGHYVNHLIFSQKRVNHECSQVLTIRLRKDSSAASGAKQISSFITKLWRIGRRTQRPRESRNEEKTSGLLVQLPSSRRILTPYQEEAEHSSLSWREEVGKKLSFPKKRK